MACAATGVVYYAVVFKDFPADAWPTRSQVPADVRLGLRYTPSAENALQYEDDEEEPGDEDMLHLEDFLNPADFYATALTNLGNVYEFSIEGLELTSERVSASDSREAASERQQDGEGRRWVLGRMLDSFSRGAGGRAFYPLSLVDYGLLVEEAQPYDSVLRQWAEALEAGYPQITFSVES